MNLIRPQRDFTKNLNHSIHFSKYVVTLEKLGSSMVKVILNVYKKYWSVKIFD